jgi:hypothetical protein
MNIKKKNAEEAKMLSLDLQQKTEIDQKVNYYKSILKAFEELNSAIDRKIALLETKEDADSKYQKNKLIIEKLETENATFDKKKFFEMWLKRSKEYDEKFEKITKECEEEFHITLDKAKEISKNNIKLKTYIENFEKQENPEQKLKNEFYLFLKYEVSKVTGKEFSII